MGDAVPYLGQPVTKNQLLVRVVILGGLLSSTLLNMLVVPVLYRLYGRQVPPDA